MGALLFVVILFVVFVGGGWLLGSTIGGLFESKNDNYPIQDKNTFIDNSVHYHVHQHEHEYVEKKVIQNNHIENHKHDHTHQNLTVIDEETHARGLGHFSNKKDSRNERK